MNEQELNEDTLQALVYAGLLALTAATLAAGMVGHGGRVMAISVALIIASVKASLIGFYYMDLRRETVLTWAILAIGAVAVATLLVGIIPDLTFRRL